MLENQAIQLVKKFNPSSTKFTLKSSKVLNSTAILVTQSNSKNNRLASYLIDANKVIASTKSMSFSKFDELITNIKNKRIIIKNGKTVSPGKTQIPKAKTTPRVTPFELSKVPTFWCEFTRDYELSFAVCTQKRLLYLNQVPIPTVSITPTERPTPRPTPNVTNIPLVTNTPEPTFAPTVEPILIPKSTETPSPTPESTPAAQNIISFVSNNNSAVIPSAPQLAPPSVPVYVPPVYVPPVISTPIPTPIPTATPIPIPRVTVTIIQQPGEQGILSVSEITWQLINTAHQNKSKSVQELQTQYQNQSDLTTISSEVKQREHILVNVSVTYRSEFRQVSVPENNYLVWFNSISNQIMGIKVDGSFQEILLQQSNEVRI